MYFGSDTVAVRGVGDARMACSTVVREIVPDILGFWKRSGVYKTPSGLQLRMNGSSVLLALAKSLTLLFGGTITLLSYRAYRRTRSAPLRALTVGIGLVTGGAFLGGLLHQVVGIPLRLSVSVQSVFTAVGFAVLTYSLYTEATPNRRVRTDPPHPSDD